MCVLQGAGGDPQHPQDGSDRPLLALAPRPQLMSQSPLPDVTRALPGRLQSLRTGQTGTSPLPTPSAQELMGSKAGSSWEPPPNCGVTPPLATREAQPSSGAWAPQKLSPPPAAWAGSQLPLRGERSPWHGQSTGTALGICRDRDVPAPPRRLGQGGRPELLPPAPEHPKPARAQPLCLFYSAFFSLSLFAFSFFLFPFLSFSPAIL